MRPSPFVHDRRPDRRFFAFDMFGTLAVNLIGTTAPIFERMCQYYPGVPPEDLLKEYDKIKREFVSGSRDRELPLGDIIRRLDSVFGFGNDPDAMEQPMLRDTHVYGPAPGADDALRYLKDNDYRIGVLSNSRYSGTTLRAMLDDYGLSRYIDVVVTSADLGVRKPNRFVFDQICQRLGTDLRHCFYCGDNPAKDYYGPLQAGMRGAVLIDPDMGYPVRFKIERIGDLPSLFTE